jgi:hypothetical protein
MNNANTAPVAKSAIAQNAAAQARVDRFAAKLTAALGEHVAQLPHDFAERLRAARMQALAARRRQPVLSPTWVHPSVAASGQVSVSNGAASMSGGPSGDGWMNSLASVAPLLALVMALWLFSGQQDDERARDLASVDVELLADDLPPAAYTDPGFAQFVKSQQQ